MDIFRFTGLLKGSTARCTALRWARAAAMGAGLLGAAGVQAAPFEIALSPSRTELEGKAGQRVGQSLDIYNLGSQFSSLAFRTLDWTLSEGGDLKFHDELLPGSCRPWVTLERRTRQIGARSNVQFRYQIDVPADAPRGECRFIVAVEGIEPAQESTINSGGASLNFPVSGRVASTVYMAVGGAKPQLELVSVGTDSVRTQRLPVVTVRNTGDAHGRLDGALEATDSSGRELELVPDGGPILPGQTRVLSFLVKAPGGAEVTQLSYPLKVKGVLDWNDGAFKVQATLP